jgi:hypothetical protein
VAPQKFFKISEDAVNIYRRHKTIYCGEAREHCRNFPMRELGYEGRASLLVLEGLLENPRLRI